jgi:hypothetical protein
MKDIVARDAIEQLANKLGFSVHSDNDVVTIKENYIKQIRDIEQASNQRSLDRLVERFYLLLEYLDLQVECQPEKTVINPKNKE